MKFMVGTTGVFVENPDKPDQFVNISELDPAIGPDLSHIVCGDISLNRCAELSSIGSANALAASDIIPALPLHKPNKFICLGLNYLDHIKEGTNKVPDYPVLFMRAHSSLVASGQDMLLPKASHELDFEAELLVIIGKQGKHLTPQTALNHVFGYGLFNDGSVRNFQYRTHQWTAGKNFDRTGAVGHIVVTPDALPVGGTGLSIQSRINGEVMQDSNTDLMMWSVADTLVSISEFTTLEPGDMIAMGTPPGVGKARTPPRFLQDKDVIEVEIETIGILSNPVTAER